MSLLLAVTLLLSFSSFVIADDENTKTNDPPSTTVTYTAANQTAEYTITVPASLAPSDNGTVYLRGTWPSDMIINVTSDQTVTLTNSIDITNSKTLGVGFTGISQQGNNIKSIEVSKDITVANFENAPLFGNWSGTIRYNVTADIIEKEKMSGVTVSMNDFIYAGPKSTPTINGMPENCVATYYFSTEDKNSDGIEWSKVDAKSLDAGIYYMYAVITSSNNTYEDFVTPTVSFEISKGSSTIELSANRGVVNVGESISFTVGGVAGDTELSVTSSNDDVAKVSLDGNEVSIEGASSGTAKVSIVRSAGKNCSGTSSTYSVTVHATDPYSANIGDTFILGGYSYSGYQAGTFSKDTGTPVTWVKVSDTLAIAQNVLRVQISWKDLNSAGYVNGKEVTLDDSEMTYKVRLFTVGQRGIGGEWKQYVVDAGLVSLFNYKNNFWGKETGVYSGIGPSGWSGSYHPYIWSNGTGWSYNEGDNPSYVYSGIGFRPALEIPVLVEDN